MPDSDELSEASVVSSSDETVKVSNSASATSVSEGGPTFAPATAASKGGSTPSATSSSRYNIPAVSQGIADAPVARAESKRGDYDVSNDGEGDLTMPPMIGLASQGLRRSPRLANQERKNYACSMLKNFCAFGMVLAAALSQPLSLNVFPTLMLVPNLRFISVPLSMQILIKL